MSQHKFIHCSNYIYEPRSNNVKFVLKGIAHSLDMKLVLRLSNDKAIDLKSEFSENRDVIFSRSTNAIVSGSFKYKSVLNIIAPSWILQSG